MADCPTSPGKSSATPASSSRSLPSCVDFRAWAPWVHSGGPGDAADFGSAQVQEFARMNATIRKFGYPASLLHEYRSWVVLLRPVQPTLGSLVLACKEEAVALGEVSGGAYAELQLATADIERVL